MRLFFRRLLTAALVTLLPCLHAAFAAGISPSGFSPPQVDLLTGDARDACEAILCLSKGGRPEGCDPALNRYFGIKKSKPSATLDARKDFLSMCPKSEGWDDRESLIDTLARGAGQCDAAILNSLLGQDTGGGGDAGSGKHIIGNQMPAYCTAYVTNPYVDLADTLPRYVGTPENDGFWVEAKDYPGAVAKYEREQQLKQDAQQNYDSGGS